jgi:acetyl-CoA synthetase
LIWKRYPGKSISKVPIKKGRDYFMDDLFQEYAGKRIDPVPMPADAPLFLMYTSGTTGSLKGCQHSTGGYLAYAAGTSKFIQDIHPEIMKSQLR